MKSKEEIEQLAEKNFPIEQYPTNEGFEHFAYKQGYTQCQEDMADMKYTEENIKQAIIYGMNTKQIDWGMVDEFIKSLNKQD